MRDWSKWKVTALRKECERKELPHARQKPLLVKQLEFAEDKALHSREGRKAHYERECMMRLDAIVTFTFFPKFPPEIRDQIWRHSLPGPRVLRMNSNLLAPHPDKLSFAREYRAPNPSALFVCQESRAVALRSYKLCFGTQDIYADLPGGDIVCLYPECMI